MAKTLETGSSPLATKLGNWTALPTEVIHPVFNLQLGYKEGGAWKLGHISLGNKETLSLFYNAILFIRFVLPFGMFLGIRWSGSQTAKAYLQTGFGWKINGRLGALFRIQSDPASQAGVSGTNVGQAVGWNRGTK